MTRTFKVAITPSLINRLKAQIALSRTVPSALVINVGVPVVGFGGLAWLGLGPPFQHRDWIPVFFWLATFPLYPLLGVALRYALSAPSRESSRYVIDDSGIHVYTKSAEYTYYWPSISKAVRSGGFLLLFFTPRCAHCLPLHALDAAADRSELEAFLASKGLAVI